MKKLLGVLILVLGIGISAKAQETQTKVKKTSSPTEKVHNTLSKHKKHNGYKVKTEGNGSKHTHKVNTKTGEVKNKADKKD